MPPRTTDACHMQATTLAGRCSCCTRCSLRLRGQAALRRRRWPPCGLAPTMRRCRTVAREPGDGYTEALGGVGSLNPCRGGRPAPPALRLRSDVPSSHSSRARSAALLVHVPTQAPVGHLMLCDPPASHAARGSTCRCQSTRQTCGRLWGTCGGWGCPPLCSSRRRPSPSRTESSTCKRCVCGGGGGGG